MVDLVHLAKRRGEHKPGGNGVREWWKSGGALWAGVYSHSVATGETTYRCSGVLVCLVWEDYLTGIKNAFSLERCTGGWTPPDLCVRNNVGTRVALRMDET